MDLIEIKGLRVFAHHGVYASEKEKGQPFILQAKLFSDLRKAGISDNLADTSDYGAIARFLDAKMKEQPKNLLEAAAEGLCRELLLHFPFIEFASLTIEKPRAPIPLDFENVSIQIGRGWNLAYIGLGGNLGDPEAQINQALANLQADPQIRLIKASPLIKTPPYGGVEQPDFLNGVCKLKTLYSPEELLERLMEEEKKASRVREIHWGPRTLDLDMLFYLECRPGAYGEWKKTHVLSDEPKLILPHPDLQNRAFVLEPLCAIEPSLTHPLLGKTVKQLLEEL
ncbi:MAG: 2-amino-4-hydroxy-6-hydroxymethyldihydropteridine diphosphokinase [Lachnospiraceae bacterium]|nr:2-amino-4-hydroxy-6-hydroxymethyldihydropteridine diphosphokinase [Lachnospiraceae bacterium]